MNTATSPIEPVAVITTTCRMVEPVTNFAGSPEWAGGGAAAGGRLAHEAKTWPRSVKPLNSSALPEGSRRNSVACSPG
jgi:hypothetical protein